MYKFFLKTLNDYIPTFCHLTNVFFYIFPWGSLERCHSSCKIFHGPICLLPKNSPAHISLEPCFLLFLYFRRLVRNDGLITQRDGWISLFILSCMWTKKKKKKPYGRFVLGDGLPFIYFFYPLAVFFPAKEVFFMGVQFLY